MGIVKMSVEEVEAVKKNTAQRSTNLSGIVNEIEAYFRTNSKEKTLTYDVSAYVSSVPENERLKKAKLYAGEIQSKLKISCKATLYKGYYILLLDKNRKIEQPKQLIGKAKKSKA